MSTFLPLKIPEAQANDHNIGMVCVGVKRISMIYTYRNFSSGRHFINFSAVLPQP